MDGFLKTMLVIIVIVGLLVFVPVETWDKVGDLVGQGLALLQKTAQGGSVHAQVPQNLPPLGVSVSGPAKRDANGKVTAWATVVPLPTMTPRPTYAVAKEELSAQCGIVCSGVDSSCKFTTTSENDHRFYFQMLREFSRKEAGGSWWLVTVPEGHNLNLGNGCTKQDRGNGLWYIQCPSRSSFSLCTS